MLAFAPGKYSATQLFLLFALIANLEALIWYKLGVHLVGVLGDCYRSISRWSHDPKTSWLNVWFLGWGLALLRPFHEWEGTKAKIRSLLEDLSRSPKYMLLAIGSWLMIPGSRSVTAVLFGMEEWPGAMIALLVVNTLHVALSFGFWAGLISSFQFLWNLFTR